MACSTSCCVEINSRRTAGQSPFLPSSVRLALAHDTIAHSETAGLAQQNPAEIFHEIVFLRFDDQESIRDKAAENQSHLLTAGVSSLGKIALELVEWKRLEIVELLENLCDGRRGVRIYAQLLALVLGRILRRSLAGGGHEPKDQRRCRIYNKREAGTEDAFHSHLNRALTGRRLHARSARPKLGQVVPLSPENVSAFHGQTPDF
jgi:hypothetical protein